MKNDVFSGMNLSDYILESVARRSTGKYIDISPESTMNEIAEFLDANGFQRIDQPTADSFSEKKKLYEFCVPEKGKEGVRWIDVHSPNVYSLLFFFSPDHKIRQSIITRKQQSSNIKATADSAIELLKTMVE